MKRKALLTSLSLLALAAGSGAAAAQTAPGADACAALGDLSLPGYDLQIASARHVTDDGVPHCLLEGSFEHRTGINGKEYALGFAISLPDDWTGRFLYQGGGGLNGTVNPPVGVVAMGDTNARDRGFAVISSDSGHKGVVWDGSFREDQIAALNFAGWSIEKVSALGKQVVAAYYGKPADHAYFAGCSTGGREGMSATQRFPLLFDGVIVGAPAMRTHRSNLSLAEKTVAMNLISPAVDGVPDRAEAFSDGDRDLILDALLQSCDGLDGIEDGMIFNTAACRFDPATLICDGDKTASCLTAEQADVVAKTFSPLLDASGGTVYPAFPYDTGIMAEDPGPGILRLDDERNLQFRNHAMSFDLPARLAEVDASQPLVPTDGWTDLGSFAQDGNKVLYYHGVSDPWFSSNDTIDYYERMLAATAPRVPDTDWSRLYLLPGTAHCSAGPAALDDIDLLTPLVEWVENGTAPEAIVATGKSFPGRSRPICAYPEYAAYLGEGDSEDAANFECRQPAAD